LIETDAPDQLLPDGLNAHPLLDPATGQPLNHPSNLSAVYSFAAQLRGEELPVLAIRVEENFVALFGAR
jgi:TatD DNase family protein